MLAAAILAAGESRRMGTPKALLAIHGTTFAEHLYAVMEHPRIGLRHVVLGAQADRIQARLRLDPAAIVVNPNWPVGQISSVRAAIRALPAGRTDGLILCPVDHPLISRELIAGLIEQFDASGKLIVLPSFQGRRGHPVIFRESLYRELLSAAADPGAREVVHAHPSDILEVPTDEEGVVLNLNDPEALEIALDPREKR